MSNPEGFVDRAVTGAAWMVAFRMLSRLIGVISTIILARVLDTSDFGIVAIAFTVSAALNSVSNVGVTENLVRFKVVGARELDTGFTIQVLKGGITGIFLIIAAPFVSDWFSEPRLRNVIYVLAVVFALSGIENIGIISFKREMRFDREFQLAAIERLLTFFITLLAAALLRSYWALIIGMLAAKIVRVTLTYVMEPYRPRLGLRAWRDLAGFSMWMWLSSLVYMVWLRADPLIVGAQVSKTMLGLYVVALDIALLPATEIMEPIGAVLFAGFAAERNAGRDLQGNAFSLAVALMAVMAPISLIISAASTDIVGVLLGPRWSAASPIVAILTLSVALCPFSNIAAQSLTASGKIRSNLLVVVCASVIKIGVLVVSARTGSLYIISVSALTVTSAETALFVFALYRNGSNMRGLAWPITRIIVSLLCAASVLNIMGLAWAGDEILSVGNCLWRGTVLGVLGGGTYAVVLYGLWSNSGRPNSPERQILIVFVPIVKRLIARGRFPRLRRRIDGV